MIRRTSGAVVALGLVVLLGVLAHAAGQTMYFEPTDDALRSARAGWHALRVWSGVVVAGSVALAVLSGRAWALIPGAYGLLALLATAGAPHDSTPLGVALVLGAFTGLLVALVAGVAAAVGRRTNSEAR